MSDSLAVIDVTYVHRLPCVDIFHEGHKQRFTLDTGAVVSVINADLAADWGLTGTIMPLTENDSGFPQTFGHLYTSLHTHEDIVLPNIKFVIAHTESYRLGIDFLFQFGASLHLHPHHPSLTLSSPQPRDILSEFNLAPLCPVTVNGCPVLVMFDTGCTDFIIANAEDALAVGLEPDPRAERHIVPGVVSHFSTYFLESPVSIEFMGKKKSGFFVIADNYGDDEPVLGMMFLVGARFFFGIVDEVPRWKAHFPDHRQDQL